MVLQVPFPKGGQVDDKAKLAAHDLAMLEYQYNRALADSRTEINGLAQKLQYLTGKINMLDSLVAEKKKEVDAARESYKLGKMTNLELQFVEGKVDQAESDYYSALFEHMVTTATLRSFFGEDIIHQGSGGSIPLEGRRIDAAVEAPGPSP